MGESRVSCHGTDQARLEINEALGHNCQWLGTCNGGSRNEFEVTSKSKWIETRLAVQEHLANFQRYIHNPAIIIQDNTSGIPMKCQAQITCKSTAGSWHELTEVADSDNHTAPKIKSIKNIKKQSPAVGRPLCGQWNEVMFCAKLTWWCSTWGNFNMFIHFQYFQCSGAKTLSRKACDVSAQPRVRRPKCCRIKWNPFPNSLLMSGALDLGLPRIHVIADPSWPVTWAVGICWDLLGMIHKLLRDLQPKCSGCGLKPSRPRVLKALKENVLWWWTVRATKTSCGLRACWLHCPTRTLCISFVAYTYHVISSCLKDLKRTLGHLSFHHWLAQGRIFSSWSQVSISLIHGHPYFSPPQTKLHQIQVEDLQEWPGE